MCKTELTVSDDISARFEAYGWQVLACDGHDMAAIDSAIAAAKAEPSKPSLVRCKTVIGKGRVYPVRYIKVHGAPLGAEEIAGARAALDWPHAPFEIPQEVLKSRRAIGQQGEAARQSWTERLKTAPQKERFEAALSGDISAAVATAVEKMKQELSANPQKVASRVASQKTIEALVAETDNLFGGSADLTGSNNTKAADQDIYSAQNPGGHYIHYGVREHGMAAMNGIALHGGDLMAAPFLVFTDYCRPSIRLTALMEQRAIYVMTHDSIGLGEDGPTHQPVEHFSALRAIPLNLFRPQISLKLPKPGKLD